MTPPTVAATDVATAAMVATVDLAERTREALAEVEAQRDDALAWLSATRALMDVFALGQGVRGTAPALAAALVAQVGVDAVAVVLRESGGTAWVAGTATQAEMLGTPVTHQHDTAWLTLAGLAGAGEPTWFRRTANGGFEPAPLAALEGPGFAVLPLVVADEPGGTLVLHTLVTPPSLFGRAAGLELLAKVVGTLVTVARARDASGWLCDRLSEELGAARRTLDSQAAGLRAREERIASLTRTLARLAPFDA